MSSDAARPVLGAAPSPWRAHLGATIVGAAATLALGLALRYGAALVGAPAPWDDALALMALTVWIGLAAGPFAAGAGSAGGALLRAGILADAAAVVLLVQGLTGPAVTWSIGVRAYALWLGLAVVAAGLVRLGRRPAARAALAVVAAGIVFVACASLFWSPGVMAHLAGPSRPAGARILASINPLFGLTQALRPLAFVWTERPVLYSITRMGQDYAVPAVPWSAVALTWWLAAAALWALLGARHAWRAFWYGT